jgi:hypothetical protein
LRCAELEAGVLRVAVEVDYVKFLSGRDGRGEVDLPTRDAIEFAALDRQRSLLVSEDFSVAAVPVDRYFVAGAVAARLTTELLLMRLPLAAVVMPGIRLLAVARGELDEAVELAAVVGIQAAWAFGEERLALGAPDVVVRLHGGGTTVLRGLVESLVHVAERRLSVTEEREVFAGLVVPLEAFSLRHSGSEGQQ